MAFLHEAAVFLGAAVIAVPVAKRLGLGAILGYLAAGAVIGPHGLGLVSEVFDVLHFAEFGVVLLLFLIGLELQPVRLWTMRQSVFGVGCMQLFVTGGALALGGRLLGLEPAAAAVVGLTLSLSSTAFALQTLAEKNQLTTRHGRLAFSILLLQDLAVIPLLALVPLLAPGATGPCEAPAFSRLWKPWRSCSARRSSAAFSCAMRSALSPGPVCRKSSPLSRCSPWLAPPC